MRILVIVAQSCPTLYEPMDYTVHGILQARILEWVAFPFSRDLPNSGTEPRSPTLQVGSLPLSLQGIPIVLVVWLNWSPHCPFTKPFSEIIPWGLWIRNRASSDCPARVKCRETWHSLIWETLSLHLASARERAGIPPRIDDRLRPKEERDRKNSGIGSAAFKRRKKSPWWELNMFQDLKQGVQRGARHWEHGGKLSFSGNTLWACMCPPNLIPVLFSSTHKPSEHTDADTEIDWKPSACLTAGPLINNIRAEILSVPLCSLAFQGLQAHDPTVCDCSLAKGGR